MNSQFRSTSFVDRAAEIGDALAALRAGTAQEASFRRLFELYHRSIHSFFVRRGVAFEDARDLTQEVFVGIYQGISSFRGDAGFDTWVFMIATNAFRKWLRRRSAGKRRGEQLAIDGVGDDPGSLSEALPRVEAEGQAALLTRERTARLHAAIEELPPQMRRCLVLRIEQEYKVREIATLLRLSPETVKAHLFQARKKLESTLGPYFRDELTDPEDDS